MTITLTFLLLSCIFLAVSMYLKLAGRGAPDWPMYLVMFAGVLAILSLKA